MIYFFLPCYISLYYQKSKFCGLLTNTNSKKKVDKDRKSVN